MNYRKQKLLIVALLLVVGASSCGPSVGSQGQRAAVQIAQPDRRDGPSAELDAEWFDNATLAEYAGETQGKEGLGAYIGETKIGWAISERTVETRAGRLVAVDVFELQFAMKYMGATKESRLITTTVYALDDGSIVSAEEQQIDEQGRILTTVERRGDQITITTNNLGRSDERTVALPKANLDQERRLTVWLLSEPAAGDSFDTFSVAWDQLVVDEALKYVFIERKSIWWYGMPTDVYVLDLISRGANTKVELETDGSIIRGSIGPIELRAEDLATVKNMEISGIDLLVMIPVDRNLGDPTRVDSLTLELSGLEGFVPPESQRQSFERTGDDTGVLRVSRDSQSSVKQPLSDEERKRFLAATPTHQADHSDIVEQARKIVGDETDPVAVADRLQQWVYQNLRKDSGADSSTALNVLDRRAGDCTEHTMLFVALARAVGLPAREVGGIAYADLGQPAFGWHAWAEIHDGERWITVDPTWNELYVDATHIKLKQDDDDFSFVNVMGRLEVRVVDFTTAR